MNKPKIMKSPLKRRRRNLLVSGLLIATAVASVWLVIEHANPAEEYLVAKRSISAGSQLSPNDIELISVNLAGSGSKYLRALPDQPVFFISSVRAGELLPLAQLANSVQDTRVPVLIHPALSFSNSIKPGSAVDIWASHSESAQKFETPRILSLGAEVSEIVEPAGMFADAGKSLEVMVHVDDLPPILAAVAAGDKFAAILKPTLIDQ